MEQSHHRYLEDVVLHEGKEKSGGWDPDREFGAGTLERAKSALVAKMREALERNFTDDSGAEWASCLQILEDRGTRDPEISEMKTLSEGNLDALLERTWEDSSSDPSFGRAHVLAPYRILSGEQWVEQSNMQLAIDQLRQDFLEGVRSQTYSSAGHEAYYFRILTGRQIAPEKVMKKVIAVLKGQTHEWIREVPSSEDCHFARRLAKLRVLRAYEVHFIPGKGIEIVDDPPAQFVQTGEPMPEQRKF